MPDTFQIEIVTPERLIVRDSITEAQIPAKDGYIGVLPGHAPLLSILGSGPLTYFLGGSKKTIAIHGGFVEVLPDHVRVLANIGEPAEEIDIQKAREGLRDATEKMQLQAGSEADPAAALEEAELWRARVDAAESK
jgi:F-type H+-transporting ATPase subunit epsilon